MNTIEKSIKQVDKYDYLIVFSNEAELDNPGATAAAAFSGEQSIDQSINQFTIKTNLFSQLPCATKGK